MSDSKKNNQVHKSIFYTLYALLGLLVLLIILLAAAPNFMLNTFGFRAYVAHYDQMEPTIKKNALVFVNRIDVDDVTFDDMITFQSNTDLNDNGKNDLITGYLDRTTGTGDATYFYFTSEGSTGDWAVVQANRIVAGYAFSIPGLGLLVDFFGSGFGIAVIVVNAALITGIVFLVKSTNIEEKKEVNVENKE